MYISRVTTSIRQLFTKLTSTGIACGEQVNTIRYNGRPGTDYTTTKVFTGQLDKEFKSY